MRKAGITVFKKEADTDEDEGLELKKKEKKPLEKDSPLKVNADKARVEKPGGEKKNQHQEAESEVGDDEER